MHGETIRVVAEDWSNMKDELAALRLRLAEVARERDERASFAAAETEHANKWAQRCDTLRAQVATMATERDDARRVAKRLARRMYPPIFDSLDREAHAAALAYEVEP